MKMSTKTIMPCLWFDTEAEDAANYYCSVFKNSKINSIAYYGDEAKMHGKKPGSVLIVEFEIEGHKFTALNGGPQFKFDEAVSFQIACETQAEADYFWNTLTEGGSEGPCGWLKDKFGLSWQIFPVAMMKILQSKDAPKVQRAMNAMMQMKKLDIAALEKAYAG